VSLGGGKGIGRGGLPLLRAAFLDAHWGKGAAFVSKGKKVTSAVHGKEDAGGYGRERASECREENGVFFLMGIYE